ncbi:Rad21/Rec8-like protein, C-terminal, eukaryotic [Fusarium oxysporum f. sp. vasinfectum]|nr:Rad21/Rec8-like protein, C-terminal, eukaryotic [Fusarium oxysporum f. sp. vasinfectum]
MFYSETLLQKSGPLASVWLSANFERKLSKKHVLQSNIADSIAVIITPSQAPMALRLSSQLLLGVVRIHQRKTHYLLDDCDHTWVKMKMAFRPSIDHDIPASLQLPEREALTLPDAVTPYDGFGLPPTPDVNWLLSQIKEVEIGPIGRKRRVSLQAPAPRPMEEEMVSELEAIPPEKEGAEGEPTLELGLGRIPIGGEEFEFHPADISRARITESPLSEIDEALARELEAEYDALRPAELHEPEEERVLMRRPEQRVKRQKILIPDEEITLSNHQIREQQANRDNITKPTAFLPRDHFLAALVDMQKSGGFVSSIMLEGRSSAELKRKRPIRAPEVEPEYGVSKSPRLEFGEEPGIGLGAGALGEETMTGEETMFEIPAFEEITAPLAPPAEHPPISIAAEHAVHILRDQFGPEAATSPGRRATASVVFQDLLPEYRTTKAKATKMFFECLVLAAKDVIKVEQGPGLGDDIRIWAKEGLWG